MKKRSNRNEFKEEMLDALIEEMENECIEQLARDTEVSLREAHAILYKSYRVFRTNLKKGLVKCDSMKQVKEKLLDLYYQKSEIFRNIKYELEDITGSKYSAELIEAYHALSSEYKTLIMVGKFFKYEIKNVHDKIAKRFVLFYDIGSAESSRRKLSKAMKQWLHQTNVLIKRNRRKND